MGERFWRRTVSLEQGASLRFVFVGGHLWLDFVNTELVERDRVVDLLGNLGDLVGWLVEAGVLDPAQAESALGRWDGPEGEGLLGRARAFRNALRGIAERLAAGRPVERASVEEINRLLAGLSGHLELVRTQEGFETRFRARSEEPERLLLPVAESAAEFLSGGDSSLIKGCQNPDCILYFHDSSKNHARRWCSMATCGNRMKAAAHYRRQKGDGSPAR